VKKVKAAILEAGGVGHEDSLHGEGKEEVWGIEEIGTAEAVLGDAEDREGLAVEEDLFVDDGRVGAEAALPEVVGEDDDGVGVDGLVIGGEDGTAEGGTEAEGFEPVAGDEGGGDDLAAVACGEAGRAAELGSEAVEGGGVLAELAEHGVGEGPVGPGFALAGTGELELDEAMRVGEGERAKEELIEEGEDGGVGTDADGQGKDGDDGKYGVLTEGTGSVLEILK
jgi:hypothetical protein